MSLIRSEAYALARHPLTESSWIVSLFTREAGKIRAVAKGGRRPKSPFAGALEPLTLCRVEAGGREGRELMTLRVAETVAGALDLFGDWPRSALLFGAVEVLERGLPNHSQEEETYRLVGALLAGLRAGADPRLAWPYFAAWFLRLHGLFGQLSGEGLGLARGSRDLLPLFWKHSLADLAATPSDPEALKMLADHVYSAVVAHLGRGLANERELRGLYANRSGLKA